jgi:hypothetical protein
MIIVRNTFSVDPTQMKDAVALAKEGRDIVRRIGFPVPRLSVDVAAEFYTLVFETEFASLADFDSRLPQNLASNEWQAWYTRFTAMIRGGRREIFRVVD